MRYKYLLTQTILSAVLAVSLVICTIPTLVEEVAQVQEQEEVLGGTGALAYVASSYSSVGYGNASITLSVPTGTQAGDIILVMITERCYSSSPYCQYKQYGSGLTGFTHLSHKYYNYSSTASGWDLLYKLADGTEGSSWTVSLSGGTVNDEWGLVAVTFRGALNCVDPIDTYSDTLYNSNNKNIVAATVTVTNANSMIVWMGSDLYNYGASLTPPSSPSSFTEVMERSFLGSSITFVQGISYLLWSSSGSTGSMTTVASDNNSQWKHAFAIVIDPDNSSCVSATTEDVNEFMYFYKKF